MTTRWPVIRSTATAANGRASPSKVGGSSSRSAQLERVRRTAREPGPRLSFVTARESLDVEQVERLEERVGPYARGIEGADDRAHARAGDRTRAAVPRARARAGRRRGRGRARRRRPARGRTGAVADLCGPVVISSSRRIGRGVSTDYTRVSCHGGETAYRTVMPASLHDAGDRSSSPSGMMCTPSAISRDSAHLLDRRGRSASSAGRRPTRMRVAMASGTMSPASLLVDEVDRPRRFAARGRRR